MPEEGKKKEKKSDISLLWTFWFGGVGGVAWLKVALVSVTMHLAVRELADVSGKPRLSTVGTRKSARSFWGLSLSSWSFRMIEPSGCIGWRVGPLQAALNQYFRFRAFAAFTLLYRDCSRHRQNEILLTGISTPGTPPHPSICSSKIGAYHYSVATHILLPPPRKGTVRAAPSWAWCFSLVIVALFVPDAPSPSASKHRTFGLSFFFLEPDPCRSVSVGKVCMWLMLFV